MVGVVVEELLLLLQGHQLYMDCEPTNEFICTTESYRNPCAVQELLECSSFSIYFRATFVLMPNVQFLRYPAHHPAGLVLCLYTRSI